MIFRQFRLIIMPTKNDITPSNFDFFAHCLKRSVVSLNPYQNTNFWKNWMCANKPNFLSLKGNRFVNMAVIDIGQDPYVLNEADQNLGACNPGIDELSPFYWFFQFFYKKIFSFKKILSTGKYLYTDIENIIFLLIRIKTTAEKVFC